MSPAAREVVVVARCIRCGAKRDVRAGEIPEWEIPMCDCGGIMVARKAVSRRKAKA